MKIKVIILTIAILVTSQLIFCKNNEKGEKQMKVALIYSSKTGTTSEIATFMKKCIEKKGCTVDLITAGKQVNLKNYQAVIVGSSIYMGKWNKEASRFIEQNQNSLKSIPVAYFSVGMSFDKTDEKSLQQINQYLEKERKLVQPIMEGRFLGRMDFSKLNFFQRMISKMVGAKEEDKRDWKAIEAWTDSFLQKAEAKQ